MVDPTFATSILDSINETLANDELDNSQREDLMKAKKLLESYPQTKPQEDLEFLILSALLRFDLKHRFNFKGKN